MLPKASSTFAGSRTRNSACFGDAARALARATCSCTSERIGAAAEASTSAAARPLLERPKFPQPWFAQAYRAGPRRAYRFVGHSRRGRRNSRNDVRPRPLPAVTHGRAACDLLRSPPNSPTRGGPPVSDPAATKRDETAALI